MLQGSQPMGVVSHPKNILSQDLKNLGVGIDDDGPILSESFDYHEMLSRPNRQASLNPYYSANNNTHFLSNRRGQNKKTRDMVQNLIRSQNGKIAANNYFEQLPDTMSSKGGGRIKQNSQMEIYLRHKNNKGEQVKQRMIDYGQNYKSSRIPNHHAFGHINKLELNLSSSSHNLKEAVITRKSNYGLMSSGDRPSFRAHFSDLPTIVHQSLVVESHHQTHDSRRSLNNEMIHVADVLSPMFNGTIISPPHLASPTIQTWVHEDTHLKCLSTKNKPSLQNSIRTLQKVNNVSSTGNLKEIREQQKMMDSIMSSKGPKLNQITIATIDANTKSKTSTDPKSRLLFSNLNRDQIWFSGLDLPFNSPNSTSTNVGRLQRQRMKLKASPESMRTMRLDHPEKRHQSPPKDKHCLANHGVCISCLNKEASVMSSSYNKKLRDFGKIGRKLDIPVKKKKSQPMTSLNRSVNGPLLKDEMQRKRSTGQKSKLLVKDYEQDPKRTSPFPKTKQKTRQERRNDKMEQEVTVNQLLREENDEIKEEEEPIAPELENDLPVNIEIDTNILKNRQRSTKQKSESPKREAVVKNKEGKKSKSPKQKVEKKKVEAPKKREEPPKATVVKQEIKTIDENTMKKKFDKLTQPAQKKSEREKEPVAKQMPQASSKKSTEREPVADSPEKEQIQQATISIEESNMFQNKMAMPNHETEKKERDSHSPSLQSEQNLAPQQVKAFDLIPVNTQEQEIDIPPKQENLHEFIHNTSGNLQTMSPISGERDQENIKTEKSQSRNESGGFEALKSDSKQSKKGSVFHNSNNSKIQEIQRQATLSAVSKTNSTGRASINLKGVMSISKESRGGVKSTSFARDRKVIMDQTQFSSKSRPLQLKKDSSSSRNPTNDSHSTKNNQQIAQRVLKRDDSLSLQRLTAHGEGEIKVQAQGKTFVDLRSSAIAEEERFLEDSKEPSLIDLGKKRIKTLKETPSDSRVFLSSQNFKTKESQSNYNQGSQEMNPQLEVLSYDQIRSKVVKIRSKAMSFKSSKNKGGEQMINDYSDTYQSGNIKETDSKGSQNLAMMVQQNAGLNKSFTRSSHTRQVQREISLRDMACGTSSAMSRSQSEKSQHTPVKLKPKVHVDTDWSTTDVYKLVKEMLKLEPSKKFVQSKILFQEFLNPEKADIFNEEEASYYASFLRRKAITEIIIEDNQKVLLNQMYEKAKTTVSVLSNHLNLTIDDFNHLEIKVEDLKTIDPGSVLTPQKESIILRNENYQETTIESLIKLLIRIKQLYDAIQELIKILSIIVKMQSMFPEEEEEGETIQSILQRYCQLEDRKQKVDQDEELKLVKCLNFLQSLSRRISRFLFEHKLQKYFVFGNSKYQITLLKHASDICSLLHLRGTTKDVQTRYGEAYLNDFIQFNEVEVLDSENKQDAMDGERMNEIEGELDMAIESIFDKSVKSLGYYGNKSESGIRKYPFGYSIKTDSQKFIGTVLNLGKDDQESIFEKGSLTTAQMQTQDRHIQQYRMSLLSQQESQKHLLRMLSSGSTHAQVVQHVYAEEEVLQPDDSSQDQTVNNLKRTDSFGPKKADRKSEASTLYHKIR